MSDTDRQFTLQCRPADLQKWERTQCFIQECRVCCTTSWLRASPQPQSPISCGIEVVNNSRLTYRTCPSRRAPRLPEFVLTVALTDDRRRRRPRVLRSRYAPFPRRRGFSKDCCFLFLFVPKSWKKAGRTSQIEGVFVAFLFIAKNHLAVATFGIFTGLWTFDRILDSL